MAKSDGLPFLWVIHLFICLFIYSFIKTPWICLRCNSSWGVGWSFLWCGCSLWGSGTCVLKMLCCISTTRLRLYSTFVSFRLNAVFDLIESYHIRFISGINKAAGTLTPRKDVRHQTFWSLTFNLLTATLLRVSLKCLRTPEADQFPGPNSGWFPACFPISQARLKLKHLF